MVTKGFWRKKKNIISKANKHSLSSFNFNLRTVMQQYDILLCTMLQERFKVPRS